jgi:hypothetical protein
MVEVYHALAEPATALRRANAIWNSVAMRIDPTRTWPLEEEVGAGIAEPKLSAANPGLA